MSDNRTAADIGKIVIKTDLTTEQMYASLVREMLWKAVDIFNLGEDFVDMVDIRFSVKGKVAGRAGKRNGRYYLDFNREALRKHWDEMVKLTLSHEVAHLVAYAKPELRAKGHNRQWKRIDIALGGDGSRCHSMGLTPARKTKKHLYVVGDVEIELSSVRHNRIMYKGYRYRYTIGNRNYSIGIENYKGEVK